MTGSPKHKKPYMGKSAKFRWDNSQKNVSQNLYTQNYSHFEYCLYPIYPKSHEFIHLNLQPTNTNGKRCNHDPLAKENQPIPKA